MSWHVFPSPCLQSPAEVEVFIPPPPPVSPSISFQTIFSDYPHGHGVSFRADVALAFPTNSL